MYSFFSRFCFGKDRLTGGPGRDFCLQPAFRVQPPLVGRGTPLSHQVSSAERLWVRPRPAPPRVELSFSFLPSWSNVHACVLLGPKTNLFPHRKLLFSILGIQESSGTLLPRVLVLAVSAQRPCTWGGGTTLVLSCKRSWS